MPRADYRVTLRFSEEDYKYLNECFEKSNFKTKASYFRHLVENTTIKQLPIFGADDILNELKSVKKQIEGIAVNVNQMAKHLNGSQKDSVLGYNVTKMLEFLPKIMDLQKELDVKTSSIQKSYIDYINKIYREED